MRAYKAGPRLTLHISGGEVSYKAICISAELYKKNKILGIITAPISKKSLNMAGYNFDGHTGLLAHLFNVKEPYLMLANKKFSTLHVTCHISLSEALKKVSKKNVENVIKIGFEHMNRYHFFKLVGIERVRMNVGCLFLEIGIFRRFLKNFEKWIFFEKSKKIERKIEKKQKIFSATAQLADALVERSFIPGCD